MDAIDLLETIEEETGPDPRWSVLWLLPVFVDCHYSPHQNPHWRLIII